jgi:uncharacterized NAD(P)/FAD-binding protein YdhS
MRRRIAIVGAGFSGAAVAAQLLRQRGRDAPAVTLIERGKRFGPGLAYGGVSDAHLLNVRASNLSMFPDLPDHFVRSLKGRFGNDASARFAPRRVYGDYVEATLKRTQGQAWGRLRRVHGEVESCRRQDGRWLIALDGGQMIDADAVVLTMGNQPSVTPAVFADVPVVDAWSPAAPRRLPRGGDVLLIGAGLTMIDVALALSQKGVGAIHAISRRGLMPRSHLKNPAAPLPAPMDFPAPQGEALHVFRRELRAMAARGEPWQHAIDRLRPRTRELWQSLPLAAQQRFLRHLRPWWDVHRHRAAPEISEQVATLLASGRLRIQAGEVVAVSAAGRNMQVQIRQRGSFVRQRLEVARVINCTGSAMDLSRSRAPLIRQLIADGLARGCANGLGFDVDAAGRLFDASGRANDSLFALGPLTQGSFWESTAVPEIRTAAAALAELLSSHS